MLTYQVVVFEATPETNEKFKRISVTPLQSRAPAAATSARTAAAKGCLISVVRYDAIVHPVLVDLNGLELLGESVGRLPLDRLRRHRVDRDRACFPRRG